MVASSAQALLLLRGRMLSNSALVALAIVMSPSAEDPDLLIATDKELSTIVRLVETDDAVRFEFTSPDSIAPIIAIDVNRNGTIDRNIDFQVSVEPGETPCLSYLIDKSSSSACKPLGKKAQVMQNRGERMATTISFPKSEISGDGFGFGFGVKLWSMAGRYSSTLVGGDYRFGGKLSLVEGPNFKGDSRLDLPPPMLTALHRYQGCVNKATDALEPLDRSKVAWVRALPVTCAGERAAALAQGVKGLVAAGMPKKDAKDMMRGLLDRYDETIAGMAEAMERAAEAI